MRCGRNARRKLRQRIEQQTSALLHEADYFSAVGMPSPKPTDLNRHAEFTEYVRKQLAHQYLTNWQKDLAACASRLGSPGAWQFLQTHLPEAQVLDIVPELRAMAVSAAERFARASV